MKKEYRSIIRSRKGAFLHEMNQKIKGDKNINLSPLKELSSNLKDEDTFDIYDLIASNKFFNELYNLQCRSNTHPRVKSAERRLKSR
jgi:hypothetical protein